MDDIELIFPKKENQSDAEEYFKEHIDFGENTLHGDSGLDNAKNYDEWLVNINGAVKKDICSFIFFAYRKSDNKMIGTINVRFPYEGYVRIHGHIGYGVRPSERRKGYATQMLSLALKKCKSLGLNKILITCDKSNIASKSTIIINGGILEKEVIEENGNIKQRYWIVI
ncbi:MAG: GNAT family N-acetyltransferase [Oscillospiraceae bacterium]|nr:GNAT family N-acetyltransferase [Oscillospiraceae bacterium]